MATTPLSVSLGRRRVRRAVPRWTPDVGPGDAMVAAAVALWVGGLVQTDLASIDDLGLVSSLPWLSFAGLVLFAGAFGSELFRPALRPHRLLAHVVLLVVMLDGLPVLIEATARTPTGWIHAGFVDYILRNGQTLGSYDARFSWPGMFSLSGLAAVAGGQTDAVAFMRWTPLVLDLVYLAPLRLIVRSCVADERVRWLALALFVIANWVEADYFSPQGVAYVAFLSVLAVVLAARTHEHAVLERGLVSLGRLRGALGRGWRRLTGPAPVFDAIAPAGRGAVVIGLTVVMAGLVVSHQLTPYALLLDLVVLALWDRLGSRVLIVVLACLALGYLSFGAQDYWEGHFGSLLGTGSLQQTLLERTDVSGGHQLVVQVRLVFSAGVLGMAALGALVQRRRPGHTGLVFAFVVAPFALVAVQSYGGEVMVRAFLFALPFVALLAAELVVAVVGRQRVVAVVGTAAVVAVGSVLLLLTRYGNEPFFRTTPDEVRLVGAVQDGAPAGTTIGVLSQNLPWRYAGIEHHQFISLERVCGSWLDLDCAAELGADYLVVTDGQRRYAEAVQGYRPDEIAAFEQSLAAIGYREGPARGTARVYIAEGAPDLPGPPNGPREGP